MIPSAGEEKSNCENETRITLRKSDIYRRVPKKDSGAKVVMLISLKVNESREVDGYLRSIYKDELEGG